MTKSRNFIKVKLSKFCNFTNMFSNRSLQCTQFNNPGGLSERDTHRTKENLGSNIGCGNSRILLLNRDWISFECVTV